MRTAIAKNQKLLPWIKEQYNKGAEIVSLCVGAFLLASTGLLNGKKCSTHWGFQNEFRKMFPNVEVTGLTPIEYRNKYNKMAFHS